MSDDDSLVAEARAALKNAHAPYSRFQVGAALRTRSGRVFRGVNVENASLGLSVCAERAAVHGAVAAGERDFEAIAVATEAAEPTPPCGSCRQVLLEFVPDMRILLVAREGPIERLTLAELMPRPFLSYFPGATRTDR